MATFAPKARIDIATVEGEVARLQRLWSGGAEPGDGLDAVLSVGQLAQIDPFDRVQLAYAVQVCREGTYLSEAGRRLFSASRERRASTNDADRLRKYLARFGVDFTMLR